MYYNNNLGANYPQRNGITWVQGIESARAYQLPPNSNAVLMDSDTESMFYIKTCDNIGMCNLRVFKYEEITNFGKNSENNVDYSQFVTKDELKEIMEGLKHEQSISTVKPAYTGYKYTANNAGSTEQRNGCTNTVLSEGAGTGR